MAGARASLQGAAKYKKAHRAVSVFNYFVVFKNVFFSLLKGSNSTVPGSGAGVARGSSLGARCL